MRYQEHIYIQNNNSGLRNRNNYNVNMSSDICTFNAPIFNLSGASKIDCTSIQSASTYIVSSVSNSSITGVTVLTSTILPLSFIFTGNTDSFSGNNASFKYEIYKYDTTFNAFSNTFSYKSDIIPYSSFSGTNIYSVELPISTFSLDGEFLIKPYYNLPVCTDFLGRLGKTLDTLLYKGGTLYDIYDAGTDYYFTMVNAPDKPSFLYNDSNTLASNTLQQQIILGKTLATGDTDNEGDILPPQPFNTFTINNYSGQFVLTLNGLTLAPNEDYTFTGTIITMNEDIVADDIVTVISTTAGNGGALKADNIFIDTPIPSGAMNTQGGSQYFLNTATTKYEIYTTVTPFDIQQIIVMINGATLANGIDFYQSTSDPKRIILEGDLMLGDVITIVYVPSMSVVNNLNTSTPFVSWQVATAPEFENGQFILELSSASTFNSLILSISTPYIVDTTMYGLGFSVSGSAGTQLFYRVKNEKHYTTLCNNIVSASTYSDVIPIIIQSNSINSY